jgi:isoquinoline 1-oxidoreductase subunit beta
MRRHPLIGDVESGVVAFCPKLPNPQELPSGVAVYATNTWAAIEDRKALKVGWDTSKAKTRSTDEIFEEYRGLLGQSGLKAVQRGD